LSIDPINGHIIELLNLALESNTYLGVILPRSWPGGEKGYVNALKGSGARAEWRDKGKGKEVVGDADMVVG
jgi:anaphase-promoting complex subunit 6